MAKTVCSDPFLQGPHPREADSPSQSYCKECSKRYQRERYRSRRSEQGATVVPRVVDTDWRRQQLRNEQGTDGVCEACGEYEPHERVLICLTLPDKSRDWCLEWGEGVLWSLWCNNCTKLMTELGLEKWNRFQRLEAHLRRQGITRDRLMI